MLLPLQIHRPKHPFFLTVIVLLTSVGAIVSLNTYVRVYNESAKDIVEYANTFSSTVDTHNLMQLTGSSSDIGTQAYEKEKARLMVLRSKNMDLRFVYLVKPGEASVPHLLMDSEHPSSADYSPPGQTYDEAPVTLIQSLKDGQPRTAVYSDRWGHWFSAYAPVRDESGAFVAILGVDEKQNELILNALSHAAVPALSSLVLLSILVAFQIVRSQELEYIESKAEFLSLASHEIRTPLTGMRWAIEEVLRDNQSGLSENTRDVLHKIYDSTNILTSRVNNILDVAMLEQSAHCTLEPIELRHYLTEILSGLELSAQQRNVTLRIDDSIDDKLVVVFDNQLMRHVFFNLVSNAIKYTKENTSITISHASEGKYNVFKVIDEGNGISPEDQKHIFNGYTRAKHNPHDTHKEGTGLGLYVVKRVVELHKGTVSLDSTPDKGTTFILKLPA